MSTPQEEKNALDKAKNFLFDLLDPKKTPKVPKAIRQRASAILKHYPLVNPCSLNITHYERVQ